MNPTTDATQPPRKQPRYNFTFENLGWEYAHSDHWFRSIDMIICEGDDIKELVESASISLIDQDGGEAGIVDLNSLDLRQQLSLELLLRERIRLQHEKEQR